MKRVYTILVPMAIGILLTVTLWAQSPEKMSYQAVIRNSSDALVTNTQVGMQISILQSSASGTAVYVETQTPTTNANGLVSLEIGTGTTSDDFSVIDWANGSYFIKTETDPAGGTNYTITGTSQLLSVPYSLHAKTAESVIGTITESDPLYSGSEAANITVSDISNLDNLSGTNTGDQDLSGIASNTQAIKDTELQIRADIPTVTTYSVGDVAQGGIVFLVDESGQHGLVCAPYDQSPALRWYAGAECHTQARGDGLYAGKANTIIIIAAHIALSNDGATYAALICNHLQVIQGGKTYGDWYLPSKYELNLLYHQKTAVGGFASAFYWSSTEANNNDAWVQDFSDDYDYQEYGGKEYEFYVRAIRAF